MTDERFQARLTRELVGFADERIRPVDAHALAADLAASGRAARSPALVPVIADRRFVLLAAAVLLIVALLIAGLSGGLMGPRRSGPLAFVRDGDLWTARGDGSEARTIASGNAGGGRLGYLYVRWAPDGRHLAAIRDTGIDHLDPAIDLFDAGGNRIRSIALVPGGSPTSPGLRTAPASPSRARQERDRRGAAAT